MDAQSSKEPRGAASSRGTSPENARNRVTRIVLTFMLTNIGSMLGLWLTGFTVYGKLAG